MLEWIIKKFFDFVDYVVAHQIPSKMGYGHQIDSPKALDENSMFIVNTIMNSEKPSRIIELAAGRGALTMKILENAPVEYYLACDIDPTGLNILSKRLARKTYSNKLETKQMNSLQPDNTLPCESFDFVIAEKFLHLLSYEEIEKVFIFACKLLKPGGKFIISSASSTNFVFERTEPGEDHPLYRKLKEDMLTRLWYNISKPYVFFITEEFIQELAFKTGFVYDAKSICSSKEDYLTLVLCKKQN
jgi:ubiquinone/menaquinone biosynthesis C-methylase UbiE